ncbi:MAG: type IV pilus biogenesis/stability protein PilW [Gammaproteobacteria bacterium]|nr:type IV pilus biogenesis/stability protein PilW [Gammaproteobacteria bacterium]
MKRAGWWPLLGLCCCLAAAAQDTSPADPRIEAARINTRLAMEYLKLGQLAVARDKIERALLQNPRDVAVQIGAGLVYERLLDNRRAERHYRQALKTDSSHPEAQNALGAFLCRNGDQQRGETMFVSAARNPLYRTPEVAYTNAGVCARGAGRLEQAEAYLRQALALRANHAEALLQLAGVAFERGNYLSARAFVQRFLDSTPVTAEVLLLGYQVEKSLGAARAALAFAERLRQEFPESAQRRALDAQTAPTPE